jgi:gamma-glutamylcyclotransferase (GGCT)/AIG2-like uncharacterized protein YtfP
LSLLKVFVYGTLKPGECNYQRYCAGFVVGAQPAVARGLLFALPVGYPAMTPGEGSVHGVLLSFANPAILRHLDELENYAPHLPDSQNEYDRQQIEVFNPALQSLGLVWAYLMTPERVRRIGGVPIPAGVWSAGCQLGAGHRSSSIAAPNCD